jgi:CheY-like chemotaxis protein/Tfp pilus assembly protein PilZ
MIEEKKKVLLVDDVRLFLQLEETFFKRTGCQIFTAASGGEALDIAAKHKPDLILLDYLMPDMNGDEVCRRLKGAEGTQKIPIIIVSTSANKEDIARCYEAGADDYVTKPINPNDVLNKAAQMLDIPYRLHRRLMVNFRVMGETPSQTFSGYSKNLSRTGILIECDGKFEPGTQLQLLLPVLPDEKQIALNGEIIRTARDIQGEKHLLGIRFTKLSPEQDQAIKDYVEKHLPKSPFIK